MSIRNDPVLRDKLAAEYVLGTLKGGARRRFEDLMRDDMALRRVAAAWQERLMPLAEFSGQQQARAHVWQAIERRLGLGRRHATWKFWRNESLAFWRTLGMASVASALLLAGVLYATLVDVPRVDYVATLADEQARTALLLTADREGRDLTVRLVDPAPVASDKSLQLWVVPRQGAPRSLGVLVGGGVTTLQLPDSVVGADVAMLAVSLEPRGGSPSAGGPTGPILYKGSWAPMM